MDNLKVFKKMGRYVAAQINAINLGMQLAEQPNHPELGLENRLLVDAWNTMTDHDGIDAVSAC